MAQIAELKGSRVPMIDPDVQGLIENLVNAGFQKCGAQNEWEARGEQVKVICERVNDATFTMEIARRTQVKDDWRSCVGLVSPATDFDPESGKLTLEDHSQKAILSPSGVIFETKTVVRE